MSKDTIRVTLWQKNGGVLSKTISAGPDGKMYHCGEQYRGRQRAESGLFKF